jgi:hypothetical protein
MKIKQVKCESGLTGYQCQLQDNYDNFSQWRAYAEMYGLHTRLGFKTVRGAWRANPVIQGSVEPMDFCKVVNGKRVFQGE